MMTPMSKMFREKASELSRALDLEDDERKALEIARIALNWLVLADSEEKAAAVPALGSMH